MKKMITAIFPGTFDPITQGHLNLLTRATALFDRIILAVAASPAKKPLFTQEERIDLAKHTVSQLSDIEVIGYDELLADFARKHHATLLLRGVRTTQDIEYEAQLANMNTHLNPELETIFLMTAPQFSFVSSSLVKEVAKYGGDVSTFLSPLVEKDCVKK